MMDYLIVYNGRNHILAAELIPTLMSWETIRAMLWSIEGLIQHPTTYISAQTSQSSTTQQHD